MRILSKTFDESMAMVPLWRVALSLMLLLLVLLLLLLLLLLLSLLT